MPERVPFTIKAFPAGHRNIARIDDYGVETVLVDAPSPGSGEVFDWRLAEGVVDPARLIVSGGLHADNVADAIAHLHPYGVDVSTGVEAEPGRKDPGKVRAFVVAARAAAGESRRRRRPDTRRADDADEGERPLRLAGRRSEPPAPPAAGTPMMPRPPGFAGGIMGEPRRRGRFGEFGGRFVPESLMPACLELEAAFRAAWADPAFHAELDGILRHYGGRPTPVTECRRLSERLGRPGAAQARGPGPHRARTSSTT